MPLARCWQGDILTYIWNITNNWRLKKNICRMKWKWLSMCLVRQWKTWLTRKYVVSWFLRQRASTTEVECFSRRREDNKHNSTKELAGEPYLASTLVYETVCCLFELPTYKIWTNPFMGMGLLVSNFSILIHFGAFFINFCWEVIQFYLWTLNHFHLLVIFESLS